MPSYCFGILDNGKLPESIKVLLAGVFPKYAGKEIRLTITERKASASDKQRKYYFGVIVPAFAGYFLGNGEHYTKDQLHDSMMRSIGGFNNPYVNPFTGAPDDGRVSYNDLTTAQAEGYHTLCRQWLAERGVDCPEPHEVNYETIHI